MFCCLSISECLSISLEHSICHFQYLVVFLCQSVSSALCLSVPDTSSFSIGMSLFRSLSVCLPVSLMHIMYLSRLSLSLCLVLWPSYCTVFVLFSLSLP